MSASSSPSTASSTLDEVFELALVPVGEAPTIQPTLMEETESKAEQTKVA